MLPLPRPPGRRPVVLIAGGGVAALETLLALRDRAGDRVELGMVSASPWFTYRPLAVAEAFGGGPSPRFDLREICAEQDVAATYVSEYLFERDAGQSAAAFERDGFTVGEPA